MAGLLKEFERAHCLVTGGAGFIGSNLARALLAQQARVTVIDNFVTGKRENLPESPGLTVLERDLVNCPELAALAAEADFVFHLAAQVGNVKSLEHTERDAQTNVLGSVRLLKACRNQKLTRLVYASSSAIFGEAERIPVDEAHPQRPASFYALSKLTAEKYFLLASALWSMPTVCLRFFNVYGLPMEQNEYSGVIPIFLQRLEQGEPLLIYGDGEQSRDFVHVSDVVQALMLAARRAPAGAVYNIGSGGPTSIRSLAETLQRITGIQTGMRFRDFRASEVRHSLADISRAQKELGFRPQYDLDRGLAELWHTMRWERQGAGS